MKKSVLALSIVITLFCVPYGDAQEYNTIENSHPTIHVKGEAVIKTIPDEAVINFGVSSEARKLAVAYKDNTSKMNSIISAIKSVGIDKKDIKTSSYDVVPVYPRNEKGHQIPGSPVSFKVSQQLMVKVRDTSKTGDIIDRAIKDGTNIFQSIQFRSSKIDELRKEVKIQAAKNAKAKAGLYAEALGVSLGRLLKVNESESRPAPTRQARMYSNMAMEVSPQIEAGSMEIRETCNLIYEIYEEQN